MSSLNAVVLLTALNALSLIASFAGNVLVAARFGVGSAMDAYGAASAVQFYVVSILSGATTICLTPLLARAKAKSERELAESFNSIFWFVAYSAAGLVALLLPFASPLVRLLTPGLTTVASAKAGSLLYLLLPSTFFLVVNDVMASAYFIRNKVMIPGINKLVAPLSTLLFVFAFWERMDVESVAWATLVGSLIQFALLFKGFRGDVGIPIVFRRVRIDPVVAGALQGMLPLWLGMLVYKAVPLLDKTFASLLSQGTISSFSYAEKCVTMCISIVLGGVSSVSFATLAVDHASNRADLFVSKVERLFRVLLLVTVPMAWVLSACSPDIVRLIFQRGNFDVAATHRVALVLEWFAWTLPTAVLGTVLSQCFYVLQKNWLVALLSLLETVIYGVVGWVLLKLFGVQGLMAAKVIYWYASVSMFLSVLKRFVAFDLWSYCRFVFATLVAFAMLHVVHRGAVSLGVPVAASAAICVVCFYAAVRSIPAGRDLRLIESSVHGVLIRRFLKRIPGDLSSG